MSLYKLFLGSLWFWMIFAVAEPVQPLPVEQAFPLQAWSSSPQMIIVQWNIQLGYYLYKDKISVRAVAPNTVHLGKIQFPKAVERSNAFQGRFLVYENLTQLRIPILSSKTGQFDLEIKYQGCSSQGYCYPPETKIMAFKAAPTAKITFSWTMWLSFFGVGLLISLTPCVLPMIPVLSALILGKEGISHWRAFIISLAYVLGMSVTFALAGILFGIIGQNLQVYLQKPWIIALFSLIFVLMALSLFGVFQLEPPQRLRSVVAAISNRQRRGSLVGAVIMGCLSTLILSPCATPPLVAILSYISQTGNASLGGIALFVVGIGSGVPLLLIGLFGTRLLPKAGPWMRMIENLLGIILLAVAIIMVNRIISDRLTLILWASLAIGVAVYLRAFMTTMTRLQLISKGLGILIFVYGILLLVGAVQGASVPWDPLKIKLPACQASTTSIQFIPVKTVEDVQQQILQASGKPLLLDFYADWCVSCKLFEQNILTQPGVQNQLKHFIFLRADVTANNAQDQALMQYYQVVAPPTLIFFSRNKELNQIRLIGEVTKDEFLNRLKSVASP